MVLLFPKPNEGEIYNSKIATRHGGSESFTFMAKLDTSLDYIYRFRWYRNKEVKI